MDRSQPDHMHQVVHRYLALWNEPRPDVRRQEIRALWAPDAVYTDPVISVTGHWGIESLITTARRQLAGHVIRLLTPIDAHHNVARFSCEVWLPDRYRRALVGGELAVTDAEGRLRYVFGFIDAFAGW